jgi:hypothetical protein
VKHNAGIVKAADPTHPVMVLYGWWMTQDKWLDKLLSPNIDMYGMDYYQGSSRRFRWPQSVDELGGEKQLTGRG